MSTNIDDVNGSSNLTDLNITNQLYVPSSTSYYDKYLFFAVCSASLGLPSNILLLVILVRTGLFRRRYSSLTSTTTKSTGSFERFLFEVVFIDTLLIIYHFVDNLLSYLREDRSAGQHYLINISDFCCKFFTYIAKMSVLLTTWLLLFLIINQLILTMEYNNNHRSFWNRGLYYVNAKYSTVFLVFIFSVYNIYPIEVLKYQKKEDFLDYQQEGIPGVCRPSFDGKSKTLLFATNYCYSLLGVALPCLIILILSIIIIYRTCRNDRYTNKESTSFCYIAGTIGIFHSLFNLPARFSDILLMSVSPYVSGFLFLISFNHETQSFITLSYAYKCFVCVIISRRFRLHAKNVLCFLIENKYENPHAFEIINTAHDWQHLSKRRRHRRKSHFNRISATKPTSKNFSSLNISKEDLLRYRTSDTTYWIRPYFTQYEKRLLLRPCGRSASCHQISSTPSLLLKQNSSKQSDTLSTNTIKNSPISSLSSYIISVTLPNGEHIHLPLPQKHTRKYRSSSATSTLMKKKPDASSYKDPMKTKFFSEDNEKQSMNRMNFLSSSYLY